MKRAGRGAMVAALLLAGQAVAMEDEGGGMDTMLVGTWQAEALLPDGRDAALRLDLDGQHRFAGTVTVDGEVETRRGRKLRGGEVVRLKGAAVRVEAADLQ